MNLTIRPITDNDQWAAVRPALWPIADLPQAPAQVVLAAQTPDGAVQGGIELSTQQQEGRNVAILRSYCRASETVESPQLMDEAEKWAASHHCLDWVGLFADELDIRRAVRQVTDPGAGGIDVFLGTTRKQTSDRGQALISLDYEAYCDMALSQMQSLLARARGQWPITRSVLLHRVGRVEVGGCSVLIAVASPHRAEAFAACRWLIDTLKVDVPIWKQERWADGKGTWVEPVSHG